MSDRAATLYFDLIDPGSLVMLRRAATVVSSRDLVLDLAPFEVRPPPEPPLEAAHPAWRAYWSEMHPILEAEGFTPRTPSRVPWTRKAHELLEHAARLSPDDTAGSVRRAEALAQAFVEHDIDLARIDTLVGFARDWGLDPTEAKAVLDVDGCAEAVMLRREAATRSGVRGVPALHCGDQLLEGLHDVDTLHTFVTNCRSHSPSLRPST